MQVGDILVWERTFTVEDVRQFAQVSGDEGVHHMDADEKGRLLVHGLLTATLPTKIGGDLNFLAQEMVFQFVRPVYTGDTIRCEVTLTHLDKEEVHTRLDSKWVCTNQRGKEVLLGNSTGIIRP